MGTEEQKYRFNVHNICWLIVTLLVWGQFAQFFSEFTTTRGETDNLHEVTFKLREVR